MTFARLPPQSSSYKVSFSMGALTMYVFPWINYLLNAWGYKPYRGLGILLGIGSILGLAGLILGIDYILFRYGLSRPVRSGMWWGATLGPMAGGVASYQWGNLIATQAIGVVSTLLGFIFGYWVALPVKKGA